jgi:hypothetical protein
MKSSLEDGRVVRGYRDGRSLTFCVKPAIGIAGQWLKNTADTIGGFLLFIDGDKDALKRLVTTIIRHADRDFVRSGCQFRCRQRGR